MTTGPEGLGWHFADKVEALQADLAKLRWWQWRKRRDLLADAEGLVSEAAEFGLDVRPLFGKVSERLRLPAGEASSGPCKRSS